MSKPEPFLKNLSANTKFKRLLGDRRKLKGLRAGLVVLKPGENIGEHSTKNKEEALIILKGKAKVSLGKKIIRAKENSFVYIPPRLHHNVENSGPGLLKYAYITSS